MQLARRKLSHSLLQIDDYLAGLLDDNRRDQTTFIWHVTVNSRKLSATVTTDIRLSPTSLVFDTAIFMPSNSHLYLIQ